MIASALPLLTASVMIAGSPAPNASPTRPAQTFAQVVDRAISSERQLRETLRSERPIVETYVEELSTDAELGAVPDRDFYFLGKLDMQRGVDVASFIPAGSRLRRNPLHGLTTRLMPWNEFFPRGFASRMFIDEGFNREHYEFSFVRREFLGDVRCIVMDVQPLKKAGKGRFEGRVWVEDRDYNVVRFNGSYGAVSHGYLHFDSWRVNAGPDLWLPAAIYTEENAYGSALGKKSMLRAQTRIWDYDSAKQRSAEETFTSLDVEMAQGVKDHSDAADETSPVEAQRMWERQGEDNVVERLQRAGLISPAGEVDTVLNTVLNNLEITNNLDIQPPVRVRIMPTTPLESISVGHTIVVSRGLIDVLPDEASLAAVLAHELAHVVLGQTAVSRFAFADRLLFEDADALKKISVGRTEEEEDSADTRALQLLKNSPYKDKLSRVGLFLRMLSQRADDVPHLLRPLLGNGIAANHEHLRLASLMDSAPELQLRNTQQVAALPLGSRVQLDPWSNQLRLLKTQNVPLLSASEKMPFEITPFMLHLRRQEKADNPVAPPAKTSAEVASGKQ